MSNKIKLSVLFLFIGFTFVSAAKPTKTIENLKSAIKGETTASAKYAAYSEKAKSESAAAGLHLAGAVRYPALPGRPFRLADVLRPL